MRQTMRYSAWFLLPIFVFGQAKEYPLTLTVWRTEAVFRNPDGAVAMCILLGDKPNCPTTVDPVQTFTEFASFATLADGKLYVVNCSSPIRRQVDLDDPVRLGMVPPGDYNAKWHKGKLKALFFGKNRQWNELTCVIKASYPEPPELKRKNEVK